MGKKIEHSHVKVFFTEKNCMLHLYKLGEFKMMDHFKNIHYTIYLHKCGCIKVKKECILVVLSNFSWQTTI